MHPSILAVAIAPLFWNTGISFFTGFFRASVTAFFRIERHLKLELSLVFGSTARLDVAHRIESNSERILL